MPRPKRGWPAAFSLFPKLDFPPWKDIGPSPTPDDPEAFQAWGARCAAWNAEKDRIVAVELDRLLELWIKELRYPDTPEIRAVLLRQAAQQEIPAFHGLVDDSPDWKPAFAYPPQMRRIPRAKGDLVVGGKKWASLMRRLIFVEEYLAKHPGAKKVEALRVYCPQNSTEKGPEGKKAWGRRIRTEAQHLAEAQALRKKMYGR
jgi:hypothetical protein